MDASYRGWPSIEAIVGAVFDQNLTQQLSKSSLDALLFFISRSDECGRIIAWLSTMTGSSFSVCGDLSYQDFVFLSEQALAYEDDYCDYQLAASFRKCESLDERAISILNQFFRKQESYTRQTVIHVFQHFGLPETIELAIELWRTDDCEFAKLSCLHALKHFPNAKPVFDGYLKEYQNMYDVHSEDDRLSHMRQLRSKNC